jgi:hypothetical protein
MKSLFRPREEVPFLPPVKPSSSGEEPSKLEGIAALTGMVRCLTHMPALWGVVIFWCTL